MRPVLGPCLLLLVVGPGCAGVGRLGPAATTSFTGQPAVPPQAVVFVVDGVGNFRATSGTFRRVVEEDRLPLHVHTVDWSHGYGRVLADHVDFAHARRKGRELAAQVACYLQPQPDGPALPVYLVAHSGGSAVVLAAAECLPPDAVERIVLLSPSVSADYDLRPALRCARQGMDVFHSRRDNGYLGLGVALLGTADRRWTAAAGRVGFRPPADTAEDPFYTRLRQYPWHPCVNWTGNQGGHFGSYRSRFLRAYVLPLLQPPGRQAAAVGHCNPPAQPR